MFQIGDKVILKTYEEIKHLPGAKIDNSNGVMVFKLNGSCGCSQITFQDSYKEYCGKVLTVDDVDEDNTFYVEEVDNYFLNDWFELYVEGKNGELIKNENITVTFNKNIDAANMVMEINFTEMICIAKMLAGFRADDTAGFITLSERFKELGVRVL